MDERQVRNPNATYNGCKMEFWKFALTWKLICPIQHKIIQKRAKETFNQDDHPYRMCNETGIPEFQELQIPGIPMVVMVTSHACSLRNPTQQDFINAHTLPIYICHT